MKRGRPAVVVCSTAFVPLAHAQAQALGDPQLPVAVIPHPFGSRSRAEVRRIAESCAEDLAALAAGGRP